MDDTTGVDIGTQPAPTLNEFSDALKATDDSGSLSDHEAAFAPDVVAAEPVAESVPATERDETGRFKPRHRAASQRADAGDVDAINAQTKRIKDAEEKLGASIERLPGESDRVYTLRRRAELLERQHAAPAAAAPPAPAPQPQPRQQPQAQSLPQAFPAYEAYIAIEGNENADYNEYVDARTRWVYAMERAAEREQEKRESAQRTHAEREARYTAALPAAKAKYADFDAVVRPDVMVNGPIVAAIMASEHGPDIAYFLAKNHDVRNSLNAEVVDYSPSVVASLRRYLDTLVAEQRTPSSNQRAAAGSTGSALALAPPPAPRPPNPVRTGAVTTADDPPGDDSSLAAHEKYFSRARR